VHRRRSEAKKGASTPAAEATSWLTLLATISKKEKQKKRDAQATEAEPALLTGALSLAPLRTSHC